MRCAFLLCLALFALPGAAATRCKPADARGMQVCATVLSAPALARLQVTQRGRNWCWAAAVSGVLRHWGVHVKQEAIVEGQFGEILDRGATAQEIVALLDRPWRDETGRQLLVSAQLVPVHRIAAMLRGPELLHDLQRNRPLVFGHRSHAMVLVGATFERGGARPSRVRVRTVTVIDPLHPQRLLSLDVDALQPQLLARVNAVAG